MDWVGWARLLRFGCSEMVIGSMFSIEARNRSPRLSKRVLKERLRSPTLSASWKRRVASGSCSRLASPPTRRLLPYPSCCLQATC